MIKKVVLTLLWVVVILGFRWVVGGLYNVPTSSMEPTILPGDRIVASHMSYSIKFPFSDTPIFIRGLPTRGDIVVFKYPLDPSIEFVKRVIGVPGDEIVLSHRNLEINGIQQTSEKVSLIEGERIPLRSDFQIYRENTIESDRYHYVYFKKASDFSLIKSEKFKVPPDHYFVMGDNRDDSMDSRSFGFLPFSYILGKAKLIVVSYSKETSNVSKPGFRWNRFWVDLE